jgi:hypothetical protein
MGSRCTRATFAPIRLLPPFLPLTRDKHGIDDVTPMRRSTLPPVAYEPGIEEIGRVHDDVGVISRRQRADPAFEIGATHKAVVCHSHESPAR